MIVPLRHTNGDDFTQAEWLELAEVKKGFIADTYAYTIESTKNLKTVPAHFHLHLVTLKEG